MKVALVLASLLAFGLAAPQPRKAFHEHYEDFLEVIVKEAGHDIQHLLEHYLEFEDFLAGLDYLNSEKFKDWFAELQEVPEFQAVLEFLENDKIDIKYFIADIQEHLDEINSGKQSRHELSGTDFTAFIKDSISEFPKTKLGALFEQKKADYEDFATAVENLQSDEWKQLLDALLESNVFDTLSEHGIKIEVVLDAIVSLFGH